MRPERTRIGTCAVTAGHPATGEGNDIFTLTSDNGACRYDYVVGDLFWSKGRKEGRLIRRHDFRVFID
jgi:hypothetical protein